MEATGIMVLFPSSLGDLRFHVEGLGIRGKVYMGITWKEAAFAAECGYFQNFRVPFTYTKSPHPLMKGNIQGLSS